MSRKKARDDVDHAAQLVSLLDALARAVPGVRLISAMQSSAEQRQIVDTLVVDAGDLFRYAHYVTQTTDRDPYAAYAIERDVHAVARAHTIETVCIQLASVLADKRTTSDLPLLAVQDPLHHRAIMRAAKQKRALGVFDASDASYAVLPSIVSRIKAHSSEVLPATTRGSPAELSVYWIDSAPFLCTVAARTGLRKKLSKKRVWILSYPPCSQLADMVAFAVASGATHIAIGVLAPRTPTTMSSCSVCEFTTDSAGHALALRAFVTAAARTNTPERVFPIATHVLRSHAPSADMWSAETIVYDMARDLTRDHVGRGARIVATLTTRGTEESLRSLVRRCTALMRGDLKDSDAFVGRAVLFADLFDVAERAGIAPGVVAQIYLSNGSGERALVDDTTHMFIRAIARSVVQTPVTPIVWALKRATRAVSRLRASDAVARFCAAARTAGDLGALLSDDALKEFERMALLNERGADERVDGVLRVPVASSSAPARQDVSVHDHLAFGGVTESDSVMQWMANKAAAREFDRCFVPKIPVLACGYGDDTRPRADVQAKVNDALLGIARSYVANTQKLDRAIAVLVSLFVPACVLGRAGAQHDAELQQVFAEVGRDARTDRSHTCAADVARARAKWLAACNDALAPCDLLLGDMKLQRPLTSGALSDALWLRVQQIATRVAKACDAVRDAAHDWAMDIARGAASLAAASLPWATAERSAQAELHITLAQASLLAERRAAESLRATALFAVTDRRTALDWSTAYGMVRFLGNVVPLPDRLAAALCYGETRAAQWLASPNTSPRIFPHHEHIDRNAVSLITERLAAFDDVMMREFGVDAESFDRARDIEWAHTAGTAAPPVAWRSANDARVATSATAIKDAQRAGFLLV